MYKLFFVFTFLALNLEMNAQNVIESLKKNPNISWHQTAIISFHTELGRENMQLSGKSRKNVVVKHQMPTVLTSRHQDYGYHSFSSKIMNEAVWTNAKNKCYADPQLSKLLTVDELQKKLATVDTVVMFDPETLQEVVHIQPTSLHSGHITHFKLFVCYAYNSKTEKFEVHPISIAAVKGTFNHLGELQEEREAFWMPVRAKSKIDPYHKDIEWLQWQELSYQLDSPKELSKVAMQQLKTLPAKIKADEVKTQANMQYGEAISPARLKQLEKVKAEDIKGLYFSYFLAWDAKKQEVIMQIEGAGPTAPTGLLYFVQD